MRILENHFCLRNVFSLKCFLITLTFVAGLTSLQAQKHRIDSLETILKRKLDDSTKVNVLLDLSALYNYVDVNKSKKLTEEAINIIEKRDFKTFKADAYQSMGFAYRVTGDYRGALDADLRVLEVSVQIKDSSRIAIAYNNIGHDYYDLGKYDEAYTNFMLSIKTAEKTKDSLAFSIAIHNLGRVFKELGQLEKALENLKFSRALSEKIKDLEGEPYYLNELGEIQLAKEEYDSALISLSESLRKSKALDLIVLQPTAMLNIAKVYIKQGDYNTALQYYDSALHIYNTSNNRYGLAEVRLGQGLAYLSAGKYDDAAKAMQQSLELAKDQHATVLEIECYQHLSSVWEAKGDFKKSLLYYKEYKKLEDALFSQEMQGKLLRDQLQFETESRDSRIAALSQLQNYQRNELKKQEFIRNILVVVMALSGILLITVYRSGQRRRKINMLLLQHQEEMEKRSEELERLNQVKDKFFSIISHDLRSPINALSGLLDLLDKGALTPQELPEHIKELRLRFHHTRTLLNNLLDWTLLQMDKLSLQPSKIDVSKIVDENIQLLGSVQNKAIEFVNDVPKPALGFADSNTINLVIRNLITNAIKFSNDGGKVHIGATVKGNEWQMTVTDNGIGMKQEVLSMLFDKTAPYTTRGTANEKGTGLGLILCKEFVEKNGGKIWVESKEGSGSTFYFTLPYAE